MKSVKKLIRYGILGLILFLLAGCSNQNRVLKEEISVLQTENVELKNNIRQLELDIVGLESNLKTVAGRRYVVDYVDVYNFKFDKVLFIEEENQIFDLPQIDSYAVRFVLPNTLVHVIFKALVNEESWVFVQIPTYDSMADNRGWIKESHTTEYTEDKVPLVQSDVEIKAGSEIFEVFNFEDIPNAKPIKFAHNTSGRLEEKKDGYCKIMQAGGVTIWVKESSVIYPRVK